MKRRDWLKAAALPVIGMAARAGQESKAAAVANPLKAPAQGGIPVAFVLSEGAVVIDFAGPWEVFENVNIPGVSEPFHLYTVAESTKTIPVSGGMKIVPEFTFENAPAPKVIVIPAQNGDSEAVLNWIRKSAKNADLTMSVCTGAFLLAGTGLLSGKAATTHHGSYVDLALRFPDIQVKRGARFVEAGNVASSGGLSSGIDLALRVVERYYGHDVAAQTAFQLEYQGEGWMNADSNSVYAQPFVQTANHPVCPVCGMDPDRSLKSEFQDKTYYFCSPPHQKLFDRKPEAFLK